MTTPASIRTRATDLLGIRYPVFLGGMGSGTSPELVAAVSNAGGFGTLGVSGQSPESVRQGIARIRQLTSLPFGVNFLLFQIQDEAFTAALAERPAVIAFAWAWPHQDLAAYFQRAHEAGAIVMHMVSTVAEARRAAAAGADLIVAQGAEGGGHVGRMSTIVLVPMVVDAVAPIPVLAAGGIADGRGLAAALALGAEGVLLGTRFLATDESPLHPSFRQAIVDSDGHDTVSTEIPDIASGRVWPGAFCRSLRNRFIESWSGREWELRLGQRAVADEVAAARAAGDRDGVPLLAGQDAGLIDSIIPAGEVVSRIVAQAAQILNRPSYYAS